jgi:outer membrane cobalamin receptor
MRTSFVRSLLLTPFFVISFVLGISFVPGISFVVGAAAGPVTGRVVDPDGRPVPGADVLLVGPASVAAAAVTDAGGRFELRAPDAGRFELRIALDGFRARPVAVAVDAGTRDVGTIALEISAVSESVVVSAAQTEVPLSTTASSVTIVTGEELRARQTQDLADALRAVPGLSVAAAGGRGAVTGVFPRGGESDYSLVVIDGVPANAFGGGFDFAHVPVVNVDRVEIVRGPQSALYGANAIGSVIRLVSRRGGPPRADASAEGGSDATGRFTGATSGGLGSWHWGASAERISTDGMNGERTDAGEVVSNDDYARRAAAAGGGWTRAGGAGIRGDVHYLHDERGFPGPFGSDPGGFFAGIDTVSRGLDDRWLAALSAAAPLGGRGRVQGQLSHGRIDSAFASPFGDSESWSRRTGARLQADASFAGGLDGSAGVEVQRERVGSTFITAGNGNEVPIERSVTGVFAEARWNRSARLFVTAGLRVERITRDALAGEPGAFLPRPDFPDDTVVSANPKVAAAWYLRSEEGDFTKVRASAGTGIRPPDGFEIAFTDNPSLAPERSRSLDAGIDHAFLGGRALVEATAFFNRYDDLIVAVGSFRGSSRFRTDNISNARSRGLELAATARGRRAGAHPIDLQLRVGYTRLDTEILAVDGGADAPPPFVPGDPLLRRPAHRFSVDAAARAGRVAAYVQGHGRGRQRDVEPSLGTFGGLFDAPGYAAWHAGVSWQVVRQVELFGRVNNLFDRTYEEVLGFPAPDRGFFAGLRVAASR